MSRESAMAAFNSALSCLRNSGDILVSGLTRRTSAQLSHFARSPWRHLMARPWPDLPSANSDHHPPVAGAMVPIYRDRSGELGFPLAVSMASKRSWPPVVSQLPGSSQIAHGVFTSPIAVLPLLPITRSLVLVDLCRIAALVALSMKRYSPDGSNSARANLKTIRACSMLAAHRTDSVPGTNRGSAGSRIRSTKYAANLDFPFPRGRLRTARLVFGAVAAAMNLT